MATGVDYIFNGQGYGSLAKKLLKNRFNLNVARPYIDDDGESKITMIQNGEPVAIRTNAEATLRKDEWKHYDAAAIKVARPKLVVYGDLVSEGLTYNIPNGMGKMVLEYETESEAGSATVSMDGLRKGESDQPEYELLSMPLPLIHSDWKINARKLEASRERGDPLDTTMAEKASRRVAEIVEKLTIGSYATTKFGSGRIYGLTNFPNRNTQTITAPTAGGWVGATLLGEFLSMIQKLMDDNFTGPYMAYFGRSWSQYLNNDFNGATAGTPSAVTLRARLKMTENVRDVRVANFLSGFQIVVFQLSSEVIRAVEGVPLMNIEWEEKGGFEICMKTVCMKLPNVRCDAEDQCGICHGNVA